MANLPTATKNVLMTGASGFIGSHLKTLLDLGGAEVFELSETLGTGIEIDLRKFPRLDAVIHLAGMSNIHDCESNPMLAASINCGGTRQIIEALDRAHQSPHFVFASTGQVYKSDLNSQNLSESSAIGPINAYAKTKFDAEKLIRQFYDGPSTILRIFNHTHKSQNEKFFVPSLVKQISDLPSDRCEILVGNLDVVRDIGAVQDLLRAFVAVIFSSNKNSSFVFNVCSGSGKLLRDLAEAIAKRFGKTVNFKVDPKRIRREPESIIGNSDKLQKLLDWSPIAISIDQLLDQYFEDMPPIISN